jgi:hypothetical protein
VGKLTRDRLYQERGWPIQRKRLHLLARARLKLLDAALYHRDNFLQRSDYRDIFGHFRDLVVQQPKKLYLC